jgi:hypothetical protein
MGTDLREIRAQRNKARYGRYNAPSLAGLAASTRVLRALRFDDKGRAEHRASPFVDAADACQSPRQPQWFTVRAAA